MPSYKGLMIKVEGRLGKNLEMRTVPDGQSVIVVSSLAYNDGYMNRTKNEWVDRTIWFDLRWSANMENHAACEHLAYLIDKFEKGDLVEVVGYRITGRAWEPTGGGEPRCALTIEPQEIRRLSKAGAKAGDGSESGTVAANDLDFG